MKQGVGLPGTDGRYGRGSTVVIPKQQKQGSAAEPAATSQQQGATEAPKQAS